MANKDNGASNGSLSVISPLLFLAKEIKLRRERAGLSQTELANRVFVARAAIGHYETARSTPKVETLQLIDDALKAEGALVRILNELILDADLSDWFQGWLDTEKRADVLKIYQPLLIPGLLQTEAYARELFAYRKDPALIQMLIDQRMARKCVLEGEKNVQLFILLNELALHKAIGTPEIMWEQFEYLLELSANPNYTFLIIPESTGGHPGLVAGVSIVETADSVDVHLDTFLEGMVTSNRSLVRKTQIKWDTAVSHSLPAKSSTELIEEALQIWKNKC